MSELKTLKDLERFEDLKHQDHFIVSSAVLKAEAMKWVKEMENSGDFYQLEDENLTNWIKHFFNLTEEDLK